MKVLFPSLIETKWAAKGSGERGQLVPGAPGPLAVALIAFCTVFVALFWVAGLTHLPKQIASRAWPTTTGVVTASEVRYVRAARGHTTASADIEFRYEVSGVQRLRRRPSLNVSNTNDFALARSVVEAHPAGSAVTVYYNPANPDEAVLLPGLQPDDWYTVLLFSIFASMPVVGWPLIFVGSLIARRRDRIANFLVKVEGLASIARPLPFDSVIGAVFIPSVFGGGLWAVLTLIYRRPDGRDVAVIWATALSLGVLLGLLVWALKRRRARRIIIDRRERVLRIPRIALHTRAGTIPLESIRALRFVGAESSGAHQQFGAVTVHWLPGIRVEFDGERGEESVFIMRSSNERNNLLLADWLADQLGVAILGDPRDEPSRAKL